VTGVPPRVVLDTNVCLDLFVFGDPRCAELAAALRDRTVDAVASAACREEWLAVLDYPQLALAPPARERALQAFDERLRVLPSMPDITLRLPRCADRDDQKFLTLAATCGARWLLSRDNALLRLGRRTLREAGFAVLTPEQWSIAWNARVPFPSSRSMLTPAEVSCPYCGEPIELLLDGSAGEQAYIEDCPVCCRPIGVHVSVGDDGEPRATVSGENDA
jgi:putative PIN family toxin of toxin-antitoxin system